MKKEKLWGYWTKERCIDVARRFYYVKDFRKEYPGAYEAAHNNGWLNEVTSHMIRKTSWSRQMCEDEAKKYVRKIDFKKGSPAAYAAAQRLGCLQDITRHMIVLLKSWNEELCKIEAKKYKTVNEFHEGCKDAYMYAYRHGFLYRICGHMKRVGNHYLRALYVFEFSDKYAYVGLSYNPEKRKNAHLHTKSSPVYKHLKESGVPYVHKVLTDYLDKEKAAIAEIKTINDYSQRGWHMLNKKRGGELGGNTNGYKYTLEQLQSEANKYTSRRDFKKGSYNMFQYAEHRKLLNDICTHMTRLHRGAWSDAEIALVAKECETIGVMQKKYPGAYKAMLKKGISKLIFGVEQKKLKRWSIEMAKNMSKNYHSIQELKENDFSLYSAIKRHKWQKECYSHFK